MWRWCPLVVTTWNACSLLGGLWSKASRVIAGRAALERFLAQCDVVYLQEVRVTPADLLVLPGFQQYFFAFGELGEKEASCRLGVVVVALRGRLIAQAVEVRQEVVWRGRMLRVDLQMVVVATLRFVSVRIGLGWSRDSLRRAFAELRRRSSDSGVVTIIWGDLIVVGDEVRFRRGGIGLRPGRYIQQEQSLRPPPGHRTRAQAGVAGHAFVAAGGPPTF